MNLDETFCQIVAASSTRFHFRAPGNLVQANKSKILRKNQVAQGSVCLRKLEDNFRESKAVM